MRKNIVICCMLMSLLLVSCNKCSDKEKYYEQISKEVEQGERNASEFSKIFDAKSAILATYNSKELTKTALQIYRHIVHPTFKQDTIRLNVAIEFLNKALALDTLNREAFQIKFNIQTSLHLWDKSLNTINQWLKKGKPNYKDYMLKGFVYEKTDSTDKSLKSFRKALLYFNWTEATNKNIEVRLQKVIIVTFLYGKEKGLAEIESIIKETGNNHAISFKENAIKDFDKKRFIDQFVFEK